MTTPWYILLDRDGTLIEDRHYLHDPDQVVLVPGAVEGLKELVRAGCRLVVLTNQSGIGRGLFDEAAMHAVHDRLKALLADHGLVLDGIFFCPHAPEQACDCRKPLPGLFAQAQAALGVDPARACVIGDKACDVDLGLAVGAASLLVRTGHGAAEPQAVTARAHAVVADLAEAARWILDHCPLDPQAPRGGCGQN